MVFYTKTSFYFSTSFMKKKKINKFKKILIEFIIIMKNLQKQKIIFDENENAKEV